MKNLNTAVCPNDAKIKVCRKALTNRYMEDFIHTKPVVVDTAHQSSAVPKEAASRTVRESKQWWAVTDNYEVVWVVGYSCAPNTPNYWWVPSLQLSMSEKFHLFATEREAIAKAGREIDEKMTELLKRRRALLAQLEKLA